MMPVVTGPDGLRFSGLSRRFGALPVWSGIAGEAAPGQVLMVTGRNGCGKSTLLRCLAGLLAPDAGSIVIKEAGRELDIRQRRRAVGFLSPDLAFYDELSVEENLTFFARLRRVSPTPSLAFAEALGLPLQRFAGVLSSGMRQRLRWAWVELAAPRVLLLDEPFQNLDPEGVEHLTLHLRRRIEAGALAVVATPSQLPLAPPLVTHELRLDR